MPFEIGQRTDVGQRRSGNEDAVDVLPLGDGALCVVADGMGGHKAGEVASQLAIEVIRGTFQREHQDRKPTEVLLQAIELANERVFEESELDFEKHGMGTTVVCALLQRGRALLANVGDSPAFLVRGEQVERLTQDHSWVGEAISRGGLKPEEAAVHPYRHILTRSLGVERHVEAQVYPPVQLQPGDLLILCSDGLSEHVAPDDLPGAVANQSPDKAAEALVDLANTRGGSDNISVIVARWLANGSTFKVQGSTADWSDGRITSGA